MAMRSLSTVALALALVAGSCATARAEVKDSARDGFSIENSVDVAADAATAWDALVDDIDGWWPKDHSWWGAASTLSIDARAGGCFCERAGRQQALHMTVTHVDPGKLLRMTGGLGPLQGMGLHGALEWRLLEQPGGRTRITLYYRAGGYSPDDLGAFAKVVDGVQALQLGGLAAYLARVETTPATPAAPADSKNGKDTDASR